MQKGPSDSHIDTLGSWQPICSDEAFAFHSLSANPVVSTGTYLSFSYHSGQTLPTPWKKFRDFPAVQWLSLWASTAASVGPIPGQGTKIEIYKKERKKFGLQFCLGFGWALPFACGLLLGARLQRLLAMVKERLIDIPSTLWCYSREHHLFEKFKRQVVSQEWLSYFWPTFPKKAFVELHFIYLFF